MPTLEAFWFACLLGIALSFFSPWVITLFLSMLVFAVAFGALLYDGQGLSYALLVASSLLAVLQVSYAIAGQCIPAMRRSKNYVKMPSDENNAG